MKKQIIILTFIAFAVLFCVSCENKQKRAATTDAENITKKSDATGQYDKDHKLLQTYWKPCGDLK